MRFVRQSVAPLAGKAHTYRMRLQTPPQCRQRHIIIPPALPQPEALPVYPHQRHQQHVQAVRTDFPAAELGNIQTPAAPALRLPHIGPIRRKPQTQRTRLDIRQIKPCPARQGRLNKPVQTHFAAHRPINTDAPAAADTAFQQTAGRTLRRRTLPGRQSSTDTVQTAAQFGFFDMFRHYSDGLKLLGGAYYAV